MKKVIAIIVLFVCSISIQAQTNDLDQQLLKKYSKKELKTLKADNPTEYEFAKYCIDHAFYIAPSSKDKIATNINRYGQIKIKNLSDVTFFELKIDLKQSKNQVFVINNTTKVLIVKSRDQIVREIKK
jgi:hypothetical protein